MKKNKIVNIGSQNITSNSPLSKLLKEGWIVKFAFQEKYLHNDYETFRDGSIRTIGQKPEYCYQYILEKDDK